MSEPDRNEDPKISSDTSLLREHEELVANITRHFDSKTGLEDVLRRAEELPPSEDDIA